MMILLLAGLAACGQDPVAEKIRTVPSTHGADLVDMEFSPDGKLLVTRGPHDLTVWEASTARKVGTVPGQFWLFSPDSALLLTHRMKPSQPAGADPKVEVWKLSELSKVRSLPVEPLGVELPPRFSRAKFLDGRRIALGEGLSVAVVDLETGTRELIVSADPRKVVDAAIVGDRLLLSQDSLVRIWNLPERKELRSIEARDGVLRLTPLGGGLLRLNVVHAVKVGETVAVEPRDKIEVWDFEKGTRLDLPESTASAVLSADGKTLAATTFAGELLRVDLGTGKPDPAWASGRTWIEARQLSSNGRTLVTDEKDDSRSAVGLWDLSTQKKLEGFPLFEVRGLPGDRVVLRSGSTFKVLDVDQGKVESTMEVSEPWISTAGGGRPLAVGRSPGHLEIIDLLRREKVTSIALPPAYGGPIADLTPCRDGLHVLSLGHDGTVRGWEIPAGKQVFEVRGFEDPTVLTSVHGYAAGTGHRLLVSDGKRVRIVEGPEGKQIFLRTAGERDLLQAVLAPDGKTLVTWSPKELGLWDSTSLASLATLQGSFDQVLYLPGGGALLHTDGQSATLFDLRDPSIRATFPTGFHLVSIAPDSDSVLGFLGTGRGEIDVVKFGIRAGRIEGKIRTEYLPIRQAVSEDGRVLVSYEPYAVNLYALQPFRRIGSLPGDHRGMSGFVREGLFCSLDLGQREFSIWRLGR